MAQHTFVLDNLASYLAGGLDAREREELEQHTATCADCARAVEEARRVDRTLSDLFAGARPRPGLEDRLISRLRQEPAQAPWSIPFAAKIVMGLAALVMVGLVGAGMSFLIENEGQVFAGASEARFDFVSKQDKDARGQIHPEDRRWKRLTYQEDSGGNSRLEDNRGRHPDQMASALRGLQSALFGGRSGSTREQQAIETSFEDNPSDANLEGRDIGLNAELPTNYNISRIEESSVPGPVNPKMPVGITASPDGPPMTIPPPPGYQYGQGGGVNNGSIGAVPQTKARVSTIRPSQDGEASRGPYYTYRDNSPAQPGKPSDSRDAYFRPGSSVAPTASDTPKEEPKKEEPKSEPKPPSIPGLDSSRGLPEGAQPAPPRSPEPASGENNQKPPEEPPAAQERKIIRSGEIEFEVESFDTARKRIADIAKEKGGFVATVNSEKLPNGKMKGSIVVRVPPERLDALIDSLRALGELKGQRIGSQDVTKHYVDLASRLRAAETMEKRLLEIIKTGKGEIKDLVAAEKELGTWQTKIEELKGEIRYYDSLINLSTLTIVLWERELRSPFAVKETEHNELGIEVEDVDKARQDAHRDIAEAKGRITKSELKQHAAGQLQAVIQFEVSPEAAGPLRDRLRQYGTVTRLEIGRLQQAEGGSGRPTDPKVERDDVRFTLSLYNLANVAPRETVHIKLACVDAVASFEAILARAQKVGQNITQNLDRQRDDHITGKVSFQVKTADAEGILGDIRARGDEVLQQQVIENPDAAGVTRSKRGFEVQLFALGMIAPRETVTLHVVAKDVRKGYEALQQAVTAARGRVLNAQLNEQDRQNITAQLDFDVLKNQQDAVRSAWEKIGDVYSRKVDRASDQQNTTDSKVRIVVNLQPVIQPRETVVLGIVVGDVEQVKNYLEGLVAEAKGRTIDSHEGREKSGEVTARLIYDVPLTAAPGIVDKLKKTGAVRFQRSARNPQVPESDLAIARLDVTVANDLIVPTDQGFNSYLRTGWLNSMKGLGISLSALIVGIMVLLPWLLVVYGLYRLVRWLVRRPEATAPAA